MKTIYELLKSNENDELGEFKEFRSYAFKEYHEYRQYLKTFGKGDYYGDFDKIMYRMHANCPDGIFERFQIALYDVNRGDMQAFHAFHRLYLNGYGAADFVRFLKPIANKMTKLSKAYVKKSSIIHMISKQLNTL